MSRASFTALVLVLLALPAPAQHRMRYEPPTDLLVQRKLAWWSDAKFGLLMHWGTYSQWGIVESWSICPEDSDWCRRLGPDGGNYAAYKASYEGLKKTFNPVRSPVGGTLERLLVGEGAGVEAGQALAWIRTA